MPADHDHPADELAQEDTLPANPAVENFFLKMNQVRRPRPSEEAVAVALQAMQRLAGEVATGEGYIETEEAAPSEGEQCPKCGGVNAQSNRFCGYCGAMVAREQKPPAPAITPPTGTKPGVSTPSAGPPIPAAPGQHIYHHHYHHHHQHHCHPSFV